MHTLPTRMLSGLISACSMEQRLSSLRESMSCWVYERTALMCSPTSLPYFFSTSRRFMLYNTHTRLPAHLNQYPRRNLTCNILSQNNLSIVLMSSKKRFFTQSSLTKWHQRLTHTSCSRRQGKDDSCGRSDGRVAHSETCRLDQHHSTSSNTPALSDQSFAYTSNSLSITINYVTQYKSKN